ncbi:hypothetical protein U9M48_004598 [Paspalum notatum var. saurae]|uniref:SWIM-type domain-containing protein n=1 Tax=Paspalum notatum var. saurae TaxID=547442 RepID=A0AAQ3SEY7_PASNO
MFWKCAKASCLSLFNIARAELAEKTAEGAQAIMNTSPHHWSRAWMKLGANCDSVDNNICESFNKWIVEPRHFPIISLLEAIRCKVMIRIQEMATKATRRSELWQSHQLIVMPFLVEETNMKCNIMIISGQWILRKKTCSCRYWQLSGLPCPHAISCIYYKTNTLNDYIAKCYHVEAFEKTYAHFLQPVEGMQNWHTSERPKPLPPKQLKMPDRPKKERKREPHEKPKSATRLSKRGSVIRCKKCKQVGHNRSTCDRRNKNNNSATSNMAAQSSQAPVNQGNTMPSMLSQRVLRTTAQGRVATIRGGSASINLEAHVPSSLAKAKVSIQVTSGTASAQAKAQEPARKGATSKTSRRLPQLLLSPKGPHGFNQTQQKARSTCLPWKCIWSNTALVSAIESVKCKFSLVNAQILSLISINNSFSHLERVAPSCHSQNLQPPSYRNTTG